MLAALAALNPDEMSPREAMEALYRLKEQAANRTAPTARGRADLMMNIAERARAAAPEAAQAWLGRFQTALQRNDAAAAAELFLPDGLWRDLLAFTWTHRDHLPAATPSPPCCARRSPHPACATSTSRKSARRRVGSTRAGTECVEAIVRVRDGLWPLQRRASACPRRRGPAARLDAAVPICTNCAATKKNSSAAASPIRRATSAPRTGPTASRTARLRRPRSGRAGDRRRPSRTFDRRAPWPARHRHPDRRPPCRASATTGARAIIR